MNRRKFIKSGALFVPSIFVPNLIRAQSLRGLLGRRAMVQASGGGSSLLSGLQFYYALENLNDSSGNGSTLTNNNSATFVAGKVSNCGNFVAASTQSLSVASNSFVDITTNDFTFAGWVKTSTTGTFKAVINKGQAFSGPGYVVFVETDNTLNCLFATNTTGKQALNSTTVTDGSWHFFCVTGTRTGNMVLQVDTTVGTPISISAIQDSASNGSSLFVGKYDTTFGPMNGNIDEVGYWNRVLSSTEIACLRNSGSGATYPFTGLC